MEQEQQEHLIAWIRAAIKPASRVAQHAQSSYGLKHVYEHGTGVYVTNGEFKGAMIACGLLPTDPEARNPVYRIHRVREEREQ